MKQYKEILEEILEKGTWKEPAREGMPMTISRFSIEKRFDLNEGFPLVTIKKTRFEGIVHELLWFLRGDSNIKYLVDNGVNIWTPDAHKYYLRICDRYLQYEKPMDIESFEENIKLGNLTTSYPFKGFYKLGDTGWTYPSMWTNYAGMSINQVSNLITNIKTKPESRYHIVNSWHPAYVSDYECALPPCHMLFHFNCRKGDNDTRYYLDCKLIQRSCDTFLGVPYNIASYAILTHIIAKLTGMIPGEFIWSGNDVHLYENHLNQVNVILEREPKNLPTLCIEDINWGGNIHNIKAEDFWLEGYESHPFVKGDLSVGK